MRCGSIAAACCAATRTTPGHTCASSPASTATRHDRPASAPSSTGSCWPSRTTRSRRAPTRSRGTSTSPSPELWWPWSMGEQPLSDVLVEVTVDGAVSHRVHRRTGFREIALEDWVVLRQRRAACSPRASTSPRRASTSPSAPGSTFRRDVELAREAGLDLVRCVGHVTRPELYDAADELGVLVWQDLPLRGAYARTVRKQAVEQAAIGRRRARSPSVDRRVVRARRAGVDAAAPAGTDVEQDGPRPVGEAGARARRRVTAGARQQRRAAARLPARRLRQPPHPRLGSRRRARPARLRRRASRGSSASSGAFGVAVGARRRRRLDRPRALARPRLAAAHRSPRRRRRAVRPRTCPRSAIPTFDQWARVHPALPGHPAAAPHRDAAPVEVPTDRRVLPVVAGRRRRRDLDRACSTTNADPSSPSRRSPTRAAR